MTKVVRTAAAIVLSVSAIGLSGCARSSGGEAAGCAPRMPHVSQDVARPGASVTVSVSAATCTPKFDDARRLSIRWRDHDGHGEVLASVTAFPSAAFERTVRIPTTAASGFGQLLVTGVETPCADTGSCAAYETGLTVVDTPPDFSTATRANRIASDVATRAQAALQSRASFVEVAIVPDGIEVVLDSTRHDREAAAAERAFADAQQGVPANERTVARAAHLHTVFVHHSAAALEHLTLHIAHDSTWQKAHGIELSSWYPDPATDSVRIALKTYDDADAVRLTKRYGDSVTVSTKDTPFASAA